MISKFFFFAIGILSVEILSAQNPIGIAEITNYSKLVYGAGAQNWDIKQGANGIMYFANNEGLLSFDGSYWKIYPVPNHTVVRSLFVTEDKIYVGAQNEIGFFAPNKKGDLTYTSLLPLLPPAERSFADVWKIVPAGKEIFFQTSSKIMQLSNGRFTIYSDEDWKFLGTAGNKIIAQNYNYQLVQLRNGAFSPPGGSQNHFAGDFLLTSLVAYRNDTSLMTTLKGGIWLLSGSRLQKLNSPVLNFIASKNIYKSIVLDKNLLFLATSLGGCFIIDMKGNLVQRFSLTEGLQNNNVRQVFMDKNRNIWLALDNGIDFIAYDNAIRHIFTDRENEGGGYAALIHNHTLFLGTSNGLYSVPVDGTENISSVNGPLKPVGNTKGQVWNLSEVYGQVLMGHHEGAFLVANNGATAIDQGSGFWNFFPLNDLSPKTMLAGTYHGLAFFGWNDRNFIRNSQTANFESARIVAIKGQQIWVAHPYKGIFKVNYTQPYPSVKSYVGKGLTSVSHYYIYAIKNRIVAPTENGIYEYNAAKDEFERSAFFEKIFGATRVGYMKEDGEGNIWFTSEKSLGVVDLQGAQPRIIYIPELHSKTVSGFDFVYPVNVNNVLVGGEKGFYNIDYAQYRNSITKIEVLIRKVKPIDGPDSLLFGGYYGNDFENTYTKQTIPKLRYKWNSLHMEFSSVFYAQQSSVEYSYQLGGFDQNWSGWSKKTEKEYTNLPPGTYTFLVKARTNLGAESEPTRYSFIVLPPWYQSGAAYVLYVLLAASVTLFFYKRQKVKFVAQRLRHEEEQKRLQYLHVLEIDRSEKAIVKLEYEKLESEINYKNKELAAATMHLVQKGELIEKIRDEVAQLLKNKASEEAVEDFKKLLRMMTGDIKVDEDWAHFTFHFDRVHGDFLLLLKSKFPNLTSNDLKLCAYLRMNLSTKEMAQLMTISVRGVELSRYRLRKKLNIPSEKNLSDFLIESVKKERTNDAAQAKGPKI